MDQLSTAPSTAKTSVFKNHPPVSRAVKEILLETAAPSGVNPFYGTRSSNPTSRPTLTLRTQSVTRAPPALRLLPQASTLQFFVDLDSGTLPQEVSRVSAASRSPTSAAGSQASLP
ncbi:hypothetical protein CVT26_002946 [Gymnopilus dilepis]|uniref:Uncharacterized protein n=1 Tax=Gymnopilus dilepis TaxID=231916 RepID=A0A409Y4M8_9AGAR|nr:hypothetical protein CVT26_002946 [Gymnopilus dilepis]